MKNPLLFQSVVERHFGKIFWLIRSNNSGYQPFVAGSGNLGKKVPESWRLLPSHEQENYPNAPLNESSIEFDFKRDWKYYIDSRQIFWSLKWNSLKFAVTKPKPIQQNTEKNQRSMQQMKKRNNKLAFFLLIMYTTPCLSLSQNWIVFQQKSQHAIGMNSKRTNLDVSDNFKAAISEHESFLQCKGVDYEESTDEFLGKPLP